MKKIMVLVVYTYIFMYIFPNTENDFNEATLNSKAERETGRPTWYYCDYNYCNLNKSNDIRVKTACLAHHCGTF